MSLSKSESADRDFPPISTLPNEILLQIFSSGIDDETEDMIEHSGHPLDLEPLGFLLTVSCVCRSWKALALSSPALWTTIFVCSQHKGYSQLFLERSYPLPISIFIIDSFRPAEVAAMTVPHFSRARSLSIRLYSVEEAIVYSKAFFELPTPNLKRFSFVFRSHGTSLAWREENDGLRFIRDVSILQSVTVKGALFPFDHSSQWQNLTFLNVRGFCPTYTQFSQLFQSAPLLEILYLPSFRWSPDLAVDVMSAPKIEAAALKNLCLGFGGGHDDTRCECPVSLLIMGKLQSLTVVGRKHRASYLAHHFSGEHAQNGFSQLTTVKLVDLTLVSRDAVFFRRLQSVRRLELQSVDGDFSSNLVQRYQLNSDLLLPLPLLESIAFRPLNEPDIQWLGERCAAQPAQLTVELPNWQEDVASTETSFEWRIYKKDWLDFPLDRGDPGDNGFYDDEEIDWDFEDDFGDGPWPEDGEDFEDYYDYDGDLFTFEDTLDYEDSLDLTSDFW
ncbi:hypothetical protein PQX77_007225 [Marasmius sp. AFHP31]|nr:hypothetical protein PQX77_007225 [Marasmius sp. AFHP31]